MKKRPAQASRDTLTFKIRLYESSDHVELLYGHWHPDPTALTAGKVGLKGANSSDYSNSVMNGTWATSTAGAEQMSRVIGINVSGLAGGQYILEQKHSKQIVRKRFIKAGF